MTLLTTSLLDTKAYDFSVLRYIWESQIVQSGVVNKGDYLVTAKASQPPMGVSVAAGAAWVKATTGTRNGAYHIVNDASVDITLTAADATNPRVDRIILRVADTSDLSSATDTATLEVLSGTPTSGATLANLNGAAAQPANTLNLAFVLVGAGVTSVVSANIGNWLDPIGTAAGAAVVSGALTTAAPAFALGRAANTIPYLVTTLPASPFDGQEVYYRADNTAGAIWHLRARSAANGGSATYPWEFVGGSPIAALGGTAGYITSTSYSRTVTSGSLPTLSVPLAGDYDVHLRSAQMVCSSSGADAYLSWTQGALGSSANERAIVNRATGTNTPITSGTSIIRATLTAAIIYVEGKSTAGNLYPSGADATSGGIVITAQPIRVG